jgi:hypothetical protein
MKIERFEEIEAWKEAGKLVNRFYGVCCVDGFKKDYGLVDKIRRAAISKSSAAELQSHLYVALNQSYIVKTQFGEFYQDANKIERQLSNFIKYLHSTLKRP